MLRKKFILAILIMMICLLPHSISQSEGPTAHLDISQRISDIGKAITFDASASENGSGNYLEYMMNYGDGIVDDWQANPIFSHSYANYGEFEIVLFVQNNNGSASIKDAVKIVPNLPIARLTAYINGVKYIKNSKLNEIISGVTEIKLSGEASFDTDLSSSLLEYNFNFGDGNSSGWQATPYFNWTYQSSGSFDAFLIVRNGTGVESESSNSLTFNVKSSLVPIIKAFPDRSKNVDINIVFDVSSSHDLNAVNEIVEYVIDFGDGTSYESSNIPVEFEHIYGKDGTFSVTLTVKNDKGEINTATIIVKLGSDVFWEHVGNWALWTAILFSVIAFLFVVFFGDDMGTAIIIAVVALVAGAIVGAILGTIWYFIEWWTVGFIILLGILLLVLLGGGSSYTGGLGPGWWGESERHSEVQREKGR